MPAGIHRAEKRINKAEVNFNNSLKGCSEQGPT